MDRYGRWAESIRRKTFHADLFSRPPDSSTRQSPEIARHGGRPAYRAYNADQQAWNAALPKRCLLAVNSELRDVVASKLILDWSPEQGFQYASPQYIEALRKYEMVASMSRPATPF
jgi:IS30 family transposase